MWVAGLLAGWLGVCGEIHVDCVSFCVAEKGEWKWVLGKVIVCVWIMAVATEMWVGDGQWKKKEKSTHHNLLQIMPTPRQCKS